MRLEKDDAKIGLLVFLTLALFVGFIFQRSLTTLLKKVERVRVRLDSAPDVAEGTEVQLQGQKIGQVEQVELRRNGVEYRFLVTLGLRSDIMLWEGTRALLVSKPLGGSFVDLQLPPPAERRQVLGPDSILAGATGPSLTSLVDDLDTLVLNLDLSVNELRNHLREKGLGAILDHPQVHQALVSLNASLQSFQHLAQDGRGLVRQGGTTLESANRTLASLDRSIQQIQALLDHHSGDLDALAVNLTGTLNEIQGLARELRGLVQQAGPDGSESLKSLDRTLRSTEELLELLKAKPNRLVWGKPTPAERDAAASKVEEARQAQGAKP